MTEIAKLPDGSLSIVIPTADILRQLKELYYTKSDDYGDDEESVAGVGESSDYESVPHPMPMPHLEFNLDYDSSGQEPRLAVQGEYGTPAFSPHSLRMPAPHPYPLATAA